MTVTGLTTCLWFDGVALEAAEFYADLFPDCEITGVHHYLEGGHLPEGTVLTVEFTLFGESFLALNAGPEFPHTPAISFQVFCDTQEEIDHLWNAITTDGGEESMCGWCSDRFGVSWQIVPRDLTALISSGTPEGQAAWNAMLTMRKLVIAELLH